MKHRIGGRKLGRPTAHRMLMLRNMATDLIRHESVKTTDSKAKEVRKLVKKDNFTIEDKPRHCLLTKSW